MSAQVRWTVAVLAVVVALAVALWQQLGDADGPDGRGGLAAGPEHRNVTAPAVPAGLRARADLRPCPSPGPAPGPAPLQGIIVECAADGSPVDIALAVSGRAVVLNLWAYWCGPCTEELPAMAEYQQRVGPSVTVLTVHQDPNEAAALTRLAELGVRLPTVQDGRRLIAAALRVPNVMPATVVLRPDGSVAEVLPRSFSSADEIAAAVDDKLGVSG